MGTITLQDVVIRNLTDIDLELWVRLNEKLKELAVSKIRWLRSRRDDLLCIAYDLEGAPPPIHCFIQNLAKTYKITFLYNFVSKNGGYNG